MSRYPSQGGRPPAPSGSTSAPLFDPAKPAKDLLDTLAEKQAVSFDQVNSSQLRRFFGEVKELYRQFEALTAPEGSDPKAIYEQKIEPRFKMVRSKVSYAMRKSGSASSKIPNDFGGFLEKGIAKVQDAEQFRLFVQHFEAVVGFMYGHDKVKS